MSKLPIWINKKEVQVLIDFINYYYRFIVTYSAKHHPDIDVTKAVPFTPV